MKSNEKKFQEILDRIWNDLRNEKSGNLSAHQANFLMLAQISEQLKEQNLLLEEMAGKKSAPARKRWGIFG